MIRTIQNALRHLLILSILSLSAHAELEHQLTPVNAANKKVTLTLFHFNQGTHKASLLPVVGNVGSTVKKLQGEAGVTIDSVSSISIKEGQINFTSKANFLVKDGKNVASAASDLYGKHTFLLSNDKGSFALGYAPLMTKSQLAFAIHYYTKSNKFQFNTAVLLGTGNDSAFFNDNGVYHAYYLKELNAAKHLLMVK